MSNMRSPAHYRHLTHVVACSHSECLHGLKRQLHALLGDHFAGRAGESVLRGVPASGEVTHCKRAAMASVGGREKRSTWHLVFSVLQRALGVHAMALESERSCLIFLLPRSLQMQTIGMRLHAIVF